MLDKFKCQENDCLHNQEKIVFTNLNGVENKKLSNNLLVIRIKKKEGEKSK